MPKEIDVAQRLIIRGAKQTLTAVSPNIEAALVGIKANPEGLKIRMTELEEAIQALSDEVFSPDLSDPRYHERYFNVAKLRSEREIIGKHGIPTFTSIVQEGDEDTFNVARETFGNIARFTHTGEWEFTTQVTDENRLISGLLIEGYGLFMEKLCKDPTPNGLPARTFVLALEEILWNKFQGSHLLKDVLPWMIEERHDLAFAIDNELKKLSPEWILKEKRRNVLKDAPLLKVLTDGKIMNSPVAAYLAINEAIAPSREDLRKRFGNKWEAFLIGQTITADSLNLFKKPDQSLIYPKQLVGILFFLGYEIANTSKFYLFMEEIVEQIKEYINVDSVKKHGAEAMSYVFFSIILAGINLRNFVDPKSIVEFDAETEEISAQPVPEAFKKFFEGLS